MDLWPAVTYIHVGIYLVFTPGPYTGDDLMNYKSLECYQRFTVGWAKDNYNIISGTRRKKEGFGGQDNLLIILCVPGSAF